MGSRYGQSMSEKRTRVGAYAVCVREGRLLLVHQSAPGPAQGKWTLPGGGVDFGESPATATVREVEEGTGGTAITAELLGVHDNVYGSDDGIKRHGVRLLYAATVAGDLECQGNDEIDGIEWHPLDDLPSATTEWAQLAACLASGRTQVT